MGNIICATRGGEGSWAVQTAAIEWAKAENQSLTFLFVTDPNSMSGVEELLITAVQAELNWMGKTLLSIAKQRALLAGIEADIVVRVGEVQKEITQYLQENKPEKILLGAPRGTTANVFGDDAIEQFALTLKRSTDIPVEIIRPEDL